MASQVQPQPPFPPPPQSGHACTHARPYPLALRPPDPHRAPCNPFAIAQGDCRPDPRYMENRQQDMTPHMRAILVDWLVEVAMEYRLCSDTLHLTVALLDRFLSAVPVSRDQLQLAGIACMWAAAKYEEIYAPSAREFCFITDNTYTPQQVRAPFRVWGPGGCMLAARRAARACSAHAPPSPAPAQTL